MRAQSEFFSGANRSIDLVDWHDAIEFANTLNAFRNLGMGLGPVR